MAPHMPLHMCLACASNPQTTAFIQPRRKPWCTPCTAPMAHHVPMHMCLCAKTCLLNGKLVRAHAAVSPYMYAKETACPCTCFGDAAFEVSQLQPMCKLPKRNRHVLTAQIVIHQMLDGRQARCGNSFQTMHPQNGQQMRVRRSTQSPH